MQIAEEEMIMTGQEMVVRGKKVSVIGMARSGTAVAQLLSGKGATLLVSDAGAAETLKGNTEVLKSLGIPYEVGGHSEQIYTADMMVISPGVPSSAPVVREAIRRGMPVWGELEVASWFCRAPIAAITGTNGKTTTTTLLGRMLHDAKIRNTVAGNIGTAFSTIVDELDERSYAVLEVSSFQLDHIQTFHPKIALLLNITPDHLDRYDGSMENYVASKCRIFENQTMNDFLIYNDDDEATRTAVQRYAVGRVRTLPISTQRILPEGAYTESANLVVALNGRRTEVIATKQISILGIHNLYNSMAAALAAYVAGAPVPSMRATLKNFKGVEHRLEFVRELRGVRYVNDSKATNIDSVWYALQAFDTPIVLMLGGRDKGNDYTRIVDLVRSRVKAIVAVGESADKVMQNFSGIVKSVKSDSMQQAVAMARDIAQEGDVVLLSPACASFDWFQNYEYRGRVFKELVNAL